MSSEEWSLGFFAVAVVGGIGLGASELAAQIRLFSSYTHYYNSIKKEFLPWRNGAVFQTLSYLNGTEYVAFARNDGWLRLYLYVARISAVILLVGLIGFSANLVLQAV